MTTGCVGKQSAHQAISGLRHTLNHSFPISKPQTSVLQQLEMSYLIPADRIYQQCEGLLGTTVHGVGARGLIHRFRSILGASLETMFECGSASSQLPVCSGGPSLL